MSFAGVTSFQMPRSLMFLNWDRDNSPVSVPTKAPARPVKGTYILLKLDFRSPVQKAVWDTIPAEHKDFKAGSAYVKSKKRISPEMAIAAGWWIPDISFSKVSMHDILAFPFHQELEDVKAHFAMRLICNEAQGVVWQALDDSFRDYYKSMGFPGFDFGDWREENVRERAFVKGLISRSPLNVSNVLTSDIYLSLQRDEIEPLYYMLEGILTELQREQAANQEAA
jgi:hypothetical protein